MEIWEYIKDFPGYEVSDHGRIHSERTGTMLSCNFNNSGTLKVNLMRNRRVHTRAVKSIVAYTFLGPPPSVDQDTPINLDGDPLNNHVSNLTWRPRWFAWKYARQFHEEVPNEYRVPILNLLNGETHANVMHAGMQDGILWEYIYGSILTGRPVYPTGATFDFLH